MVKNLRANIETGASIVIAIAVVVIAVVVVKRYISPPPPPSTNAANEAEKLLNKPIQVPTVDWGKNKQTLVFFLRKDCVYCETSAPLYRQLIDDATQRNVKLLAILPNSAEESRQYVQTLGLPIQDLYSSPLSDYNIPGTPTLLFVDGQGITKGAWVGASTGHEKEMRGQVIALMDRKS